MSPRIALVAALLAAPVPGCGRHSVDSPPPEDGSPAGQRTAVSEAAAAASAGSKATAAQRAPERNWSDAIRLGEWRKAAKLLDTLDEKQRERADIRFARARVAAELGDAVTVLSSLDGLEKQLPLVIDEIRSMRARAQLEVGPFDSAADAFEKRGDPRSLQRAAIARERAGELKRAKKLIDRALVGLSSRRVRGRRARERQRERIAEARLVRARIALRAEDTASARSDLVWISVNAPLTDTAIDAERELGPIAPNALTKQQRYDRAMAFAGAGALSRFESEMEALEKAPGKKLPEAELLRAKGWAQYLSRNDYALAADLLGRAARAGSSQAVKDRFYAARATSRAHRDDEAIELYREFLRKHPGSGYAERARYNIARLQYIAGRWKQAEAAYDSYLKKHGKRGRFVADARYELAVTQLAAGQHAQAAKALSVLADAESDRREKARLIELEGVALAGAGKVSEAAQRFRRVIDEQPLSYAALAAAARLKQLGKPVPPQLQPAERAEKPAELSVRLPPKARLYLRLGFEGAAERELRRHEAQLRKAHEPRGWEALCTAYGRMSRAARRYRVGQRAVRWSALMKAPSARTRWTWECIYPTPYRDLVSEAEKEWKLPPHLMYAVMRQESAFHPTVVSPARAVGLMQMIPPTAKNVAKALRVEYDPSLLRSPVHNIRFGGYYLRRVLDTFGGNVALAAAAYNAGPRAVSRWLESGEQLPLDVFIARIPYSETRGYVGRVLGNRARYAYFHDGEAAIPELDLEIAKGHRAGADAY